MMTVPFITGAGHLFVHVSPSQSTSTAAFELVLRTSCSACMARGASIETFPIYKLAEDLLYCSTKCIFNGWFAVEMESATG